MQRRDPPGCAQTQPGSLARQGELLAHPGPEQGVQARPVGGRAVMGHGEHRPTPLPAQAEHDLAPL